MLRRTQHDQRSGRVPPWVVYHELAVRLAVPSGWCWGWLVRFCDAKGHERRRVTHWGLRKRLQPACATELRYNCDRGGKVQVAKRRHWTQGLCLLNAQAPCNTGQHARVLNAIGCSHVIEKVQNSTISGGKHDCRLPARHCLISYYLRRHHLSLRYTELITPKVGRLRQGRGGGGQSHLVTVLRPESARACSLEGGLRRGGLTSSSSCIRTSESLRLLEENLRVAVREPVDLHTVRWCCLVSVKYHTVYHLRCRQRATWREGRPS